MVFTEMFNSTFENNAKMDSQFWKTSKGSSISSIEESYRPEKIKSIVEDLVMSKFGNRRKQLYYKSMSRKSRSSTSSNYSDRESDPSMNTYDVSELISHRRSSMSSLTSGESRFFWTQSIMNSMDLSGASAEFEQKLLLLSRNKTQILKAISWHRQSKRGSFLQQRIEAEKLLLVNDFQTILLVKNDQQQQDSFLASSGSVKISDICIFPEETTRDESYYLCLLTNGDKVYASEVAKLKTNGIVTFKKQFEIEKVQPNVFLNLHIYSITAKDLKKSRSLMSCNLEHFEEDFRGSLFRLWGETQLRLQDFGNHFQAKMKSGYLTGCTTSKAGINIQLEGFLDVGKFYHGHPVWDRKWCSLNGRLLQIFNYPHEEPNRTLDLSESLEIRGLEREELARKFTILVRFKDERVLLACQDEDHYMYWRNYLKIVKTQIELWDKL